MDQLPIYTRTHSRIWPCNQMHLTESIGAFSFFYLSPRWHFPSQNRPMLFAFVTASFEVWIFCARFQTWAFLCVLLLLLLLSGRSYSSNNMNEWMNWRRRLQFSEQIVLNVFCYLLKVQRLRCISWIWRHWKFTFTDLRFHSSCYYSFDRCSVFPQMTLTTLWMSIELLFCVFVFSFSLYPLSMAIQSPFKSALFDIHNTQRLISRYIELILRIFFSLKIENARSSNYWYQLNFLIIDICSIFIFEFTVDRCKISYVRYLPPLRWNGVIALWRRLHFFQIAQPIGTLKTITWTYDFSCVGVCQNEWIRLIRNSCSTEYAKQNAAFAQSMKRDLNLMQFIRFFRIFQRWNKGTWYKIVFTCITHFRIQK